MKYIMIAIAAGAFIACNEGPDDKMEERSDRQEQIYDTPEMSGEYDEMRDPIREIHPPRETLPVDGVIHNDSLIVPDENMRRHDEDAGMTTSPRMGDGPVSNSGGSTTTTPMNDGGTTTGTQPVMPEGDSPHHSSEQIEDDAVIHGHTPATDPVPQP